MSDSSRVETDSIEDALAGFQAIRDDRLRKLINVLPLAIVAATTVFVGARWYSGRTQEFAFLGGITGSLAAVVAILITRELFDRFPQTLLLIWRRKVLRPRFGTADTTSLPEGEESAQDGGLTEMFSEFVSQSEDQMNSKVSLISGILLMLIVLVFVPFFGPYSPSEWVRVFSDDRIAGTLSILIRLIFYAGGFLGGLLIWRIATIARRIHRLGIQFDFKLQYGHPDRCGGLRPIGDLCLTIGLILSPLLLLVGGWLAFISLVGTANFEVMSVNLATTISTLQILIIPLAILSLVGFVEPLTAVHEAMQRSRRHVQDELDSISQQIHHIGSELLTNANLLSADEGTSMEEKIDFLRRVYERSNEIPTWPIDYNHLLRFGSAQIIPAIGLAASAIGTLQSFLPGG